MKCDNCGDEIFSWETAHEMGDKKICPDCNDAFRDKFETLASKKVSDKPNDDQIQTKSKTDQEELNRITLTTETNTKDLEIKERLGIISSESALGMNMFRDIFTNLRDLVGGQSVSTQKILKDLKSTAFQDIKEQAHKLGADAVVAIDLDYSEFSGPGRSMLFLVATGTAVKLKEENVTQDQT